MKKTIGYFLLSFASFSASFSQARADVFLRPGESIFLGGQRVQCGEGGGGHGNRVVSKRFRCEPVESSYPSLENYLKMTVEFSNGEFQTANVSQFHRQSDCNNFSREIAARCSDERECSAQYCEADDGSYPSLAATLYNVRIDRSGQANVSAVDRFSRMSDCRHTD